MGCSTQKSESSNIPYIDKIYEDYIEPNSETFEILLYYLGWKLKNEICSFIRKSKEELSKRDIHSLEQILIFTKIKEIKNYSFEYDRNFILYIYSNKGVIITRNYKKVNFFIKNYMNDIIKICFVDYSEVYKEDNIYFSFNEVKEQSRYFFYLNNKEINFMKRNELINYSKSDILSDCESDLSDDSFYDDEDFILNNRKEEEEIFKENINTINIISNNNEVKNNDNKNINNCLIKDENANNSLNIDDLVNNQKIEKLNNNIINDNNLKKNFNEKENKNYLILNKISNKEENNKFENINNNEIDVNVQKNDFQKNLIKIENENVNTNKIELKEKLDKDNNNKNNINYIKMLLKDKNLKESLNVKKENEINIIQTQGDIKDNDAYNNELIEINEKEKEKEKEKILLENLIKNTYRFYKKNTLIISSNKLTEESNIDFENIFFDMNINKNLSFPLYHIDYLQEESDKNINIEKEEKNDYILIYKKNKISYSKMKSLNNIKKVIFINCNFTYDNIYYQKEFFYMLSNYENLKKVAIYKNNISKDFKGWKFFISLFKNNYNIRCISFKGAELGSNLIIKFLDSLQHKRIRILNLYKNNLTNEVMYNLNKLLLDNQTLTDLDLSDNYGLNSSGLKMALKGLKSHPNLKNLNLNNINLNKSGELLSNLLKENKNLNKLKIRNCNINYKDLELITIELCKDDCSIIYLDISQNKDIGDIGLEKIGKFILYNKSLKHLSLDDMNINISNYMPIFQSIYKNRNIESYSLDMNKDMPLKGFLNFLKKNTKIKKISFYPWDRKKEPNKVFSIEQLNMIQEFQLRVPNMLIKGFDLIKRKMHNIQK